MGKNFLRINDLVKFSLVDPDLIKVKDDYEGAFLPEQGGQVHHTGLGTIPGTGEGQQQQIQNGLQVRIAATHSGIITRNNGFYLPDRMKKGSASFTDNYPKPVLLHHRDDEDPIGRIIAAEYFDTSGAVQDKYNGLSVKDRSGKEVGTITDRLIADFVGDKMPFGMQVDITCSLLRDSILSDSEYSGLGHIQVVANITDAESIQKLLDGRYLTGSVGATTDAAVCSVCRQDWTEAGQCEHKPGGIYDSAKCFIIAGSLNYEEYSFVNVPADRHSGVLELNYNGVADSVEFADDYSGRLYEVQLSFPQFSTKSKEEIGMAKKKKDAAGTPEGTEVVIADSVTPTPPEGEKPAVAPAPEGSGAVQDAAGDPAAKKPVTPEVPGDTPVVDDVNAEGGEESIEDFVVRVVDAESLSDEEEVKLYDEMWTQAEAGFADSEFTLEQLGVEKLEDAKLSVEKRKKLASSKFCGTHRSFPVTDAAHVSGALRLVAGAKLSDEAKEKILKGVNRKAKAMGVAITKKDALQTPTGEDNMNHARMMHVLLAALEENHYSGSDDAPLQDEEKGMLSSILKRLAGVVGKDAVQEAVIGEGLASGLECVTALEDDVVKSEELVGDLRDQLDALRKEYTALGRDMETLQDSLVEEKTLTRKAQEGQVSLLKVLRDTKEDETDWTSLTDEGIQSELTRLTDEVDITKIVDKLGDGISREPSEGVDDPTGIHDNVTEKKYSVADMTAIELRYHEILLKNGKEVAASFIQRMQLEGRLPQESDE